MAITGLDHVNISTVKLAKTKAFFIDILGLEEGWRPPFEFDGAWLYVGGKEVVHLAQRKAEPRLQAAGIAYRELEAPAGGIRQLFFADVNEATIEFNWRPV